MLWVREKEKSNMHPSDSRALRLPYCTLLLFLSHTSHSLLLHTRHHHTAYPRSNSVLRDLLDGFEDHLNTGYKGALEGVICNPDLQDIKQAYQHMYKRSLEEDIANETSFGFKSVLLELLRDPNESLADQFNEAFAGSGTNDNMLIELCATRSRAEILAAAKKYEEKYGKTLADEIKCKFTFLSPSLFLPLSLLSSFSLPLHCLFLSFACPSQPNHSSHSTFSGNKWRL